MPKNLYELKAQLDPTVVRTADINSAAILAQLSLAEVRKLRGTSQVTLAQTMAIAQPGISQIEKRPDALVSTLQSYIEALGGKLELRAVFPEGEQIEITQFRSTEKEPR
jgi:DNA-binding XRE family transcriptional regulator